MTAAVARLREEPQLSEAAAAQLSPLTLAYIGDGAYELLLRTLLVRSLHEPVNRLHRRGAALAKAETQSALWGVLEAEERVTDVEAAVYRRGRNARANTHAKHAAIQDYRRATGFEAVCGFLYLSGQTERLLELVEAGLSALDLAASGDGRGEISEARNHGA